MAKVLDLKRKVNKLVKKSKVTDDGFSYLCNNCDFECVGRKGIVVHIKDTHEEVYSELKLAFNDTSEKDFLSQLSKLVMNVPFSDQDAKPNKKGTDKAENGVSKITKTKSTEDDEIEEDSAIKSYPLTIDFMRTIDGRTTRIPNYGSLVGRIARLVAMVVKKETKDDSVMLTCQKCDTSIEEYKDIFTHIEKDHSDFLQNLYTMFPPAKKRMEQFMTKAAENFELEVPTWAQVEKLQRQEKDKKDELKRVEKEKEDVERKLEMAKKLEEAKNARAELQAKREEAEKNRLAVKRKQEEDAKIQEFKFLKVDPNDENAQEKLKCKKEILRIEKSLKEKGTMESRKTYLTKRLDELKDQVKTQRLERKEKMINKRMETCLENLSPKQLRKLCLEYFNNIENQAGNTPWADICESVKIGDDYEFLTDFLSALHDLSNFHEKKSFKVGHILVTSKQSATIKERGVVSIRDFVKKNSWRIPSSWDFDIPEEDLGEEWNRKDDSRLLIGASRFGKNLKKILACFPSMAAKALDSSGVVVGSVKRRFGYLLNIYMNRGVAVDEFGDTLYSVDVDEEDGNWEEELEEDEVDEEVMEIDKNGQLDNEKMDEKKDSGDINGGEKNESTKSENDEEVEEVEEVEDGDDEIEELEDMAEEDL